MQPLIRETLFWIAAFAVVIAEVAILRSAFRVLPDKSPGSRRFLETVWAILPALALVWVLIATWGEMHRMSGHDHMKMPMTTTNG
jgi:heme/copper-type cytochrome/quinol oxidase subunit 2